MSFIKWGFNHLNLITNAVIMQVYMNTQNRDHIAVYKKETVDICNTDYYSSYGHLELHYLLAYEWFPIQHTRHRIVKYMFSVLQLLITNARVEIKN